MIMKES